MHQEGLGKLTFMHPCTTWQIKDGTIGSLSSQMFPQELVIDAFFEKNKPEMQHHILIL